MKNVLAIRRADQFSPNSVEKDRAILMAVVEKLEQPVRVMDEDEYEGYKSWYLYYKDVPPGGKVPVPVDVDGVVVVVVAGAVCVV